MGSEATLRFADGDTIFKQGAAGGDAYVVRSGKARIFRVGEGDRETTLTVLGSGEIFGEMSLFERMPRSASAEAVGETELQVISETELEQLVGDTAVLGMLKKMSARIREVDDAVEKLSVEGAKRREALEDMGIRRSLFT